MWRSTLRSCMSSCCIGLLWTHCCSAVSPPKKLKHIFWVIWKEVARIMCLYFYMLQPAHWLAETCVSPSWSLRVLDITMTYHWCAVHIEIFLAIQVIISKTTSFHLYVGIAFDSSVWLVVFNLDMSPLFLSCVRVHGVGGKSGSFVPLIIGQSGVWVYQLTASWLYSFILFCRGSRRWGFPCRGSRGGEACPTLNSLHQEPQSIPPAPFW